MMFCSDQSCLKGRCHSGPKTLSEDGPDVEGIRAAYKLLTNEFAREQLSVGIYHSFLSSKRVEYHLYSAFTGVRVSRSRDNS